MQGLEHQDASSGRLHRHADDVARMDAVLDVRQIDRARRLGSALRSLACELADARREIATLKSENEALREELNSGRPRLHS